MNTSTGRNYLDLMNYTFSRRNTWCPRQSLEKYLGIHKALIETAVAEFSIQYQMISVTERHVPSVACPQEPGVAYLGGFKSVSSYRRMSKDVL